MTARILIVEDEAPVRQGLVDLLSAKGYEVLAAETGPEGLLKAQEARPDLVLLDVMLPGMNGFEVLKALRANGGRTPVVMLSAKGTEFDRVTGFELGVDDYVTKPFSILELVHRIQAVLRRTSSPAQAPLSALTLGPVEVDFQALALSRAGQPIDLPARAVEMLAVLARAEGSVVGRDRLLDEVWGADQEINPRTVDNMVVKLRQALEERPEEPRVLLTVHGRGYRLVIPR